MIRRCALVPRLCRLLWSVQFPFGWILSSYRLFNDVRMIDELLLIYLISWFGICSTIRCFRDVGWYLWLYLAWPFGFSSLLLVDCRLIVSFYLRWSVVSRHESTLILVAKRYRLCWWFDVARSDNDSLRGRWTRTIEMATGSDRRVALITGITGQVSCLRIFFIFAWSNSSACSFLVGDSSRDSSISMLCRENRVARLKIRKTKHSC